MQDVGRVLITGAASGIGRALALKCCRNGWQVAALDKDADGLDALHDAASAEAEANVPWLLPAELGSLDHDDCDVVAEAVLKEFGGLDCVVHAAFEFGTALPLENYPQMLAKKLIDANVIGPVALTQSLIPLLRESHGMAIFSRDSVVDDGAYWGFYGLTRATTDYLVRMWDAELTQSGVRCVSFDVGHVGTGLRSRVLPGATRDEAESPATAAERLFEQLRLGLSNSRDALATELASMS